MITLPISDYPTSSDPKARMQAFGERKSELTLKQQSVQDSSLSEDKKQSINSKLENEKKSIDVKIQKLKNEEVYRKKLETKRLNDKRLEAEKLKKQTVNTKSHLDKRV